MISFQKPRESHLTFAKLLVSVANFAQKAVGTRLSVTKKQESQDIKHVIQVQKNIGQKKTKRKKKMIDEQLAIIEETAFYESGLSAHGCLEDLDDYAKKAIHKYGRILLKKQKENFINGFQGCCYCCEPVGLLNQKLEAQLRTIEEDGTEEHNAAVKLRQELAKILLENDELKAVAKKLYGTVLHVFSLAKEDPLVLIGPELYKEAASGANDYEKLNGRL